MKTMICSEVSIRRMRKVSPKEKELIANMQY